MSDILALIESSQPEYAEVVESALMGETQKGLGQFSLWFVLFSTITVLIIFAYQLVRLIRQCTDNHNQDRDFFCPAKTDLEIQERNHVMLEGVDPAALLDDEDWSQGGDHRIH